MDEHTDHSHAHHHQHGDDEGSESLRHVKRLLRSAMSGPVSASMRAQGLTYRLNFGVDQPRLADIADELRATEPDTAALAAMLWKEDIRECRILACMLMPADRFDRPMAEVWIEQIRFAEEAQAVAMHLLVRLPYASDLAFALVSGERPLDRLTGWLLFGRLFSQRRALTQRDADEFLDHVATELHDTTADPQLRQTALNALNRYGSLGDAENARSERIIDALWS